MNRDQNHAGLAAPRSESRLSQTIALRVITAISSSL